MNQIHWVDRITEVEKEEEARKKRIAQASAAIFDVLRDLATTAVKHYNKSHPTDLGQPYAVIVPGTIDGHTMSFSVKKRAVYQSEQEVELKFIFPINDGLIEYHSGGGKGAAEIKTNNPREDLTFIVKGNELNPEAFIELMLKDVLFPAHILAKVPTEALVIEIW